ncbi:MAG: lipid-A-disaccharide synthase [Proteobacteria bacterium]|nr:lipid-A-disaccharide synthase [Pseudomonadota bacterium]
MLGSSRTLRVVIVVGEVSGDMLGSALLKELNLRFLSLESVGIGGPLMAIQGFSAWYPMSELSVMGYVEVLLKLPRLLRIRSSLAKKIVAYKPDLVIGVDAPDFNLSLERTIRNSGIPVIHLVSPSIWAWRYERIHKIRQSVDHMLVLFPFEEKIYEQEGIPVSYVGHPLADEIEPEVDRSKYRSEFGFSLSEKVVALLPGSRKSELKQHLSLMIDAAKLIQNAFPEIRFVVPLLDKEAHDFARSILSGRDVILNGAVDFIVAQTHNALKAVDIAIVASGTATLEGLLCECPMVVTYKVSKLTAWLIRRRASTRFVSLPNIISNESLVSELIQEDAQPDLLAKEVILMFQNPDQLASLRMRFRVIKSSLRMGAAKRSADVIQRFLNIE